MTEYTIDRKRLDGMLGLAARAGKVQSGEFCAEKSIRSGRAKVCILASDASENTAKHMTDMCSYRNIPVYSGIMDKEQLGHLIGRGSRVVVTVEDEGFAGRLEKIIQGGIASE